MHSYNDCIARNISNLHQNSVIWIIKYSNTTIIKFSSNKAKNLVSRFIFIISYICRWKRMLRWGGCYISRIFENEIKKRGALFLLRVTLQLAALECEQNTLHHSASQRWIGWWGGCNTRGGWELVIPKRMGRVNN